ncbi:hypothetical protein [Mycobacterium colombiense]|uniref:hypothetical protein n=1 Tax=Mycobacterium colombiense TaxID=339268 RepID=UPI0012DB512C|nr:hypothetical protein [Mycobacterium colombiense]
MGDADPTKRADVSASDREHTVTIPDSSETAAAELAWSAAADEQERHDNSGKGSRALWLGPVMALLAAAIAVASVLLFYVNRTQAPKPPAPAPPSASAGPAALPTSGQTASASPVVLPDAPPSYAGCLGAVVAHYDIQHKTLGAVRLFLVRANDNEGCVAAVANSGQALPPIRLGVGVGEIFAFANPATDATGNTFVLYNPGRYDGVLALIPDSGGFEDIGWDDLSSYQHFSGKHAYYYAQLLGPGTNGEYTIRRSHNDCTPDCASGTTTAQDLHWNGNDYVP